MFGKSTFLLAAFAAAAQLASAQSSPACLLAAINTFDNPADVKTICGKSSEVNDLLNNSCGDNTKAAKDAFNTICKNNGVQVSLSGGPTSSGNATSSSTTSTMVYTSQYYNTSCSCTTAATLTSTTIIGTSTASSTGGSGSSSSASATGTSSSGGSSGSSGSGTSSGSSSGTGSGAATQTGAADKFQMAGLSVGAIAIAGLAVAL